MTIIRRLLALALPLFLAACSGPYDEAYVADVSVKVDGKDAGRFPVPEFCLVARTMVVYDRK